jgi:hypothetical protein
MTTSKLFKNHFGETTQVDLKHPNIEAFFNELNEECLKEDTRNFCIREHLFFAITNPVIEIGLTKDEAIKKCKQLNTENDDMYMHYQVHKIIEP